jgi:uncharacterized protein YlxW (UPF0749 family)
LSVHCNDCLLPPGWFSSSTPTTISLFEMLFLFDVTWLTIYDISYFLTYCSLTRVTLGSGKCCAYSETYKTKELPKDMRPLQELVREQESHILDLQREVDTLRHAINDYQKEIERLEAAHQDNDETSGSSSSRLMLERKTAMEDEAELRLDQLTVYQNLIKVVSVYNSKHSSILLCGISVSFALFC